MHKLIKLISYSFLVTTFVVNITLGATLTAYAAPPEDLTIQSKESKQRDTGLLTGLLALGLFSMLTNGGNDTQPNGSAPTKAQTPNVPTSPTTRTAPSGISANEKRAVDLMNQDRIANGLQPLKLNIAVTLVARSHGQDMINRNYFAHNSPDGKSPFDRLRAAGISYRTAGENLAINRSVDAAEKAFMNSPGHRANILNTGYTEVGIGVSYAPNGSVYVVQNFIGK